MVEKVVRSTQNSAMFNKFASNEKLANPVVVQKNEDSNKDSFVQQEKTVNKKKVSLPFVIASSALLTGGSVLLMTKGLPKNTGKHLESIKNFLEHKLEKSKIKGKDSWSRFYVYSIRKLNSFIERAQSLNNLTSLKDTLFKKFMYSFPVTKSIHKNISEFFERISRNTVVKSYKSTSKKFNKLYSEFDRLDDLILKNKPDEIINYNGALYKKSELIAMAKKQRNIIKDSVSDFISENKYNERYNYIRKVTSTLYEKFWDKSFKDFWSKNNKFRKKEMWQTFIPEKQMAGDKRILTDEVAAVRNKISYTDADRYSVMSEHIKTLENIVAPTDKEGFKIIKKLEWFLKNPEGLSGNKEVFLRELNSLKERPFESGLSDAVISNQQDLRNSHIKAITDLLKTNSGGELQEMLSIYEAIAPYELSYLRPTVTKAVRAFDKSLKLETVEFFDKVRDLQLGSAPTDVLSILASGCMIAYGLGDAENKNERISVTLTSGIPIIGAIATSLICTAKLISGGKAMASGLISGLCLNMIGKTADSIRKKNIKNHTND